MIRLRAKQLFPILMLFLLMLRLSWFLLRIVFRMLKRFLGF